MCKHGTASPTTFNIPPDQGKPRHPGHSALRLSQPLFLAGRRLVLSDRCQAGYGPVHALFMMAAQTGCRWPLPDRNPYPEVVPWQIQNPRQSLQFA